MSRRYDCRPYHPALLDTGEQHRYRETRRLDTWYSTAASRAVSLSQNGWLCFPMSKTRLDLKAIEQSLREVQRAFPKINEVLRSQRDSMTDEVVENMMDGYTFVDKAITDDVHLLLPQHAMSLLELNHVVLCGSDPQVRQEYKRHIDATTRRFYEQEGYNIDDILRWYHTHCNESPWKRAAGVYVRILSQPQLYIEGNHRTGALIMSYILVRDGKAPFVLTVENAKAYFDPSTLVKNTKKTKVTLLTKLPRIKTLFSRFLKCQANEAYICGAPSPEMPST